MFSLFFFNFLSLSVSGILQIYLNLCEPCQLKKAKVKKSIVVKPILSKDFNSRCQVDLIDLQARPSGEYKFIMVYQDHLTKYVLLRPLKTKTAAEVAKNLFYIFTDFGTPNILHSDNGREFANKVVSELVAKWPDCKIVHGKPRHSQSQGSVERANQCIGNILTIWCRENNSTEWAEALPLIQIIKNRRYHRGINRSPYEALFGVKMNSGNELDNTPDIEESIGSEEEEHFVTIDGSEWVDFQRVVSSEDVDDDFIETVQEEERLNQQFLQQKVHREQSLLGLSRQADKMLESSCNRYATIEVGTNVRVPVPEFDRSKIDSRNLMGVVINSENGFYKIGTSSGVISQAYSRNQIEPCASSSFLSVEQVPDTEISLRSAAGASSVSGQTQGHIHCGCNGNCETKKCRCKNSGRQCNSKCHHSRSCGNK